MVVSPRDKARSLLRFKVGMAEDFFIERRPDGRYNVERPNASRPSAVEKTQADAIARARAMNPNATIHVERVRQVGPGRDKWRKV